MDGQEDSRGGRGCHRWQRRSRPCDKVLEKYLKTIAAAVGKNARSCVIQDHLKGRLSEVGYLNGLVVKKGKQANVATPYNRAITELTRQIELRALKPDRSNLALVQQMIQ